MKLLGYWRSTAAYRVRIALAAKGIDYDYQSVHLVKDGGEQHKADFVELNPQRLVPVLIDGDMVINQSMAILEYLEEKYPQNPLLPKAPNQRAQVRAFCQEIVSDIHPLNNLRVLQYLQKQLGVDEDGKLEWYRHWIQEGFQSLERRVDPSAEFFCFGTLTLADVCLIPQLYNARRFSCDLSAFPRLTAIEEHCLSLECFDLAVPENQVDAN